MSDLVVLAQEIVKWQENLAEHEKNLLYFQEGVVKHQKEVTFCAKAIVDLKQRLAALCRKSPEPDAGAAAPIAAAVSRPETSRKRSRSAEPRNREKTIAYDSVDEKEDDKKAGQSKSANGACYKSEEAGGSHGRQEQQSAGKGKQSACPWYGNKSELPCAFSENCPECCADPESAAVFNNMIPKKKRKEEKPAKPPLCPETAAAVEKLMAEINRKKSESSEKTEDDEDFEHHEDECGLSASEQKKPCWNTQTGWHNSVIERFEDWGRDNYPFLFLSKLSQIAQARLKTCTLGHFITVAHDVDLWHIPSITSNAEFSVRLAERLE